MTDQWITVPVEPTPDAFDKWARENSGPYGIFSPGVSVVASPFYYAIWSGGWDAAMLAAAPRPDDELARSSWLNVYASQLRACVQAGPNDPFWPDVLERIARELDAFPVRVKEERDEHAKNG